MITRRTFLAAGTGAIVAGTAAVSVGVGIVQRPWLLDLATLRGLVGGRFTDEETGRTVVLDEIAGPAGAAPTADAFTLRFTADDTSELPGAIRSLWHDGRPLVVYVGPTGPEGETLEAVVDRTV